MADKARRLVEDALSATGLPWSIETGSRHLKVRVAGRFVAIMPKDGGSDGYRAIKNVTAAIRRTAREIKGE